MKCGVVDPCVPSIVLLELQSQIEKDGVHEKNFYIGKWRDNLYLLRNILYLFLTQNSLLSKFFRKDKSVKSNP